MVEGRPPIVLVSVFIVVYSSGSLSDTSLPILARELALEDGRLLLRLVVLAGKYKTAYYQQDIDSL